MISPCQRVSGFAWVEYTFNDMWTLHTLAPLVVGLLTAAVGIAVLIRERATPVSVAFWLMSWVGATWLLSYVGIYLSPEEPLAVGWAKIENVAVVYIPTMVILFSMAATEKFRWYRLIGWGTFCISTLFCATVLLTDWFVAGVYTYRWGYYARYGPMSIPFLVFFFALLAFSLSLFWSEYQHAITPTQKQRYKSLLIAFGCGYLGSVDYLPAYGIPVYPFGFLPVFIFNLLVARAIWTYRLVDITPAFAAKQIIKTMADALLVLDRDGLVRVVNQAACELFGRTEAELVGNPIWAISSRFLPGEKLEVLLRRKVIQGYDLTYPAKGGMLTLDVCASAIRDSNNQAVGVVCIARDVTQRKQASDKAAA